MLLEAREPSCGSSSSSARMLPPEELEAGLRIKRHIADVHGAAGGTPGASLRLHR
eukprot:CAMPEP_0170302188 /NCGR_PEP_ID=MMETSP0116_2-20130129/51372_1 /TAXON_ID=400756 /ORGANISM="Durinskia baltica, Strain CSIRO CS-38" /LENGTH=54 /DNA_ID=CAMNT_0010554047 /DNA_START=97 /DNA_END=257 /DNA_ORIENTATION=+